VTEKAIEMGMYTKEEITLMSQEDIIQIIFHNNFSTKNEVTDWSGRGVGMTALKVEIEKIGGKLSIETKQSIGTTFTFFLPDGTIRKNV
jgi:two-component system chemotaxis sensor kinase CheA